MTITGSLLRLGRELRYRPLPIIGQRVVIETLADVEHVLRQLATPWITRDVRWDGCDVELGLAKYGLLDRWCGADPRELDGDGALRGIPALRANGLGTPDPDPDPDPAIDAAAREIAEDSIAALAAGVGTCVLKLFLEDGLSDQLRFDHNRDNYRARRAPTLLPGYFPRPFVVGDACITNAPAIWAGKHFYM